MPTKQGKDKQDHNRPHHRDWPQFGQKNCFYTGEKRQKDKWFHFHAATVLGFPKAKTCWKCEVAEAHKCWTFDMFEVHEAQNTGLLGGRFSKHKNAGNSEDLYLLKFTRHEKPGIWGLGFMKHKNARNLMSAKFRKHKHVGNFRMSGLMKLETQGLF